MSLAVIKNDSPKVNKQVLYYKAYEKVLDGYRDNPGQDKKAVIKKLIFYGTKAVIGNVLDAEPIERQFEFADIVQDLMATLTPGEFENIFPVTKEYDGDQWETKDYFYTMRYVNGLSQDEPIGEEILNFLWEYHNIDIHFFIARLTCLMSDTRRLQGYPGIMEEWAADNGISTYTMHTDTAGKKFMVGSDGKTMRVKPSLPKYLRVVQRAFLYQ